MGFNKRFVNLKRIREAYHSDPAMGISLFIGKSDALIFECDKSYEIVHEWMKGDRDKAIMLIEDVSRITDQVS